MKRYTSECGTQNNDYASEQWGRLYSLRTCWKAGPAGREAGCGQGCPPYVSPLHYTCWHLAPHLSFSVVSANSAMTSPAIQKRAMIFDSCQPSASK